MIRFDCLKEKRLVLLVSILATLSIAASDDFLERFFGKDFFDHVMENNDDGEGSEDNNIINIADGNKGNTFSHTFKVRENIKMGHKGKSTNRQLVNGKPSGNRGKDAESNLNNNNNDRRRVQKAGNRVRNNLKNKQEIIDNEVEDGADDQTAANGMGERTNGGNEVIEGIGSGGRRMQNAGDVKNVMKEKVDNKFDSDVQSGVNQGAEDDGGSMKGGDDGGMQNGVNEAEQNARNSMQNGGNGGKENTGATSPNAGNEVRNNVKNNVKTTGNRPRKNGNGNKQNSARKALRKNANIKKQSVTNQESNNVVDMVKTRGNQMNENRKSNAQMPRNGNGNKVAKRRLASNRARGMSKKKDVNHTVKNLNSEVVKPQVFNERVIS